MRFRAFPVVAAVVALGACTVDDKGQYVSRPPAAAQPPAVVTSPVAPTQVALLDAAPRRAFTVIKPLKVNVNKLTAFHPNPTEQDARDRLRAEAAALGADAVIDVTVSDIKVTPLSWGARTATGTAIRY